MSSFVPPFFCAFFSSGGVFLSQEFLAYLLDGIHEDVNRVRQKPFVESVEANGGEDDETAARRAWDAHLKRNDSFVVDTMHGQYKSVRIALLVD